MLHQYIPALKSYHGIVIDAGDQDEGIAATVRELHGLLDGYGIAHQFEIYEGDHTNRIEERLREKALPFFSRQLDFGK